MAAAIAIGICHFFNSIKYLTHGTAIKATTAGLMPLNAEITVTFSLKSDKYMAMSNIITKDGMIMPRTETKAPSFPRIL